MKKHLFLSLLVIPFLFSSVPVRCADNAAAMPELWFYYSTNLQVPENLASIEAVFRKAAAAGYTQVVITDSKFGRLANVPPIYGQNVEKVKQLAEQLHLEIIPCIFPVGYSDSLLSNDPSLVEALPVRDALFVVSNGAAAPVTEPEITFPQSGFFDPKKWDMCDPVMHLENGVAHASQAAGHNARVAKKLTVTPFHQYDITIRIKTQNYEARPVVQVLGDNLKTDLNNANLSVKPTQDWKQYHIVFNSLDNHKVLISFRAGYTGSNGDLWWDQPAIHDAGLLNIVRRDSTPLVVKTEQGEVLREGKDFEHVNDPKMGHVPWAGGYDVWHEPPVLKTHLPDGTRLRVSFCHSITTDNGKVMICPSEPKTVELLKDQARRMEALWHPKRYFMEHDEIRVLGWDPACEKRHLDAGGLLADNVRTCTQILHEVNPSAKIYVWSDMFDPFHNAHDHYYLVKGDYKGSWEGLDPSVSIANWNFEKLEQSLAWFAGRGHHQIIAGYYDAHPERIAELLKRADDTKGLDAVMYTTWSNRYDELEPFADAIKKFYAK